MGTQIATIKGMQVPAHIRERQQHRRADYSDVLGASVKMNRISLEGNRFSLKMHGQVAASTDKKYLDVAIVARSKIGRQWFEKAYDPKATEDKGPPMCFSQDGLTPDLASPKKQCSTCKLCPKNQKGSHPSGRGKWCTSIMRLAVQTADDEKNTYIVDAKGMSLFGEQDPEAEKNNLTTYLAKLGEMDLETPEVWTRMTFDKNSAVPKLYFQTVGFLEPDHISELREKSENPVLPNMLRIGGVAPVAKPVEADAEAEEPAPVAVPKKPAAKALPPPAAVEEEAEEEAAPPPPPKKAAAPKAAPKRAAPPPPAVEEAEEEEAPPPPPRRVAKQAVVEEAEVVDDTPPPPPKKAAPKRAAPPPPADDDEDAPAPAPAPKARAVQARPAPKAPSMDEIDDGLSTLVGDWKAPAAA